MTSMADLPSQHYRQQHDIETHSHHEKNQRHERPHRYTVSLMEILILVVLLVVMAVVGVGVYHQDIFVIFCLY